MSSYTPVKGDRVRVVIEGEVRAHNGAYFVVEQGGTWAGEFKASAQFSIKKIEPQVEQFKVGDIVRDRDSKDVLALGPTGYTYVSERGRGAHYPYSVTPLAEFNSEDYERVEV